MWHTLSASTMATYGQMTPRSAGPVRRTQAQLLRVRKGQMLSGVCSGLEACGRGNATAWRLLFVFLGLYIIGIIVYAIMSGVIPYATPEEEAAMLDGKLINDGGPSGLDKIETDLAKINTMKSQGLITEEEYELLRKKALGLDATK